jgi:photosystem II stability/assembly factor-like uncharacterized protein
LGNGKITRRVNMNKLYRFIFYLTLGTLFIVSKTEAQWFWQNPLPQGNTLLAIASHGEDNITAVGHYGTVLRTTNGGETWIWQSIGTRNLSDIYFTNSAIGIAVGEFGTIVKTTNGGETWLPKTSSVTKHLWGVSFADENYGMTVGYDGTILKTTDGGETWTLLASVTTYHLLDVCFIDQNHVIALGTAWESGAIVGNILRSTNGGTSWSIQYSPIYFTEAAFTDVNTGTIVGEGGTIMRTTDGGASWITQIPTGLSFTLLGVSFTNSTNGMAVGNIIMKTTDGGAHWITQSEAVSLNGIILTDENRAFAVGDYGKIMHTTNGGINWLNYSTAVTINTLHSVSFFDKNTGLAVGRLGTIVKTTNAGSNWYLQPVNSNFTLWAVDIIDEDYAIAVGGDGLILRTTNGGQNWMSQRIGTDSFDGVCFTSRNIGTVVSSGGTILRTSDGGQNWITQFSDSLGYAFCGVFLIDDNNGTVVGRGYDGGIILRTTNGGNTWDSQTDTSRFWDVAFADPNHGIIVGDWGTILLTSDGGANWTNQISGINSSIGRVSFADSSNVYALTGKIIFKSTDRGVNWTEDHSSYNSLMDIFFTDKNSGNVVGEGGTIMRMGEVPMFVESIVMPPDGFTLHQNYPNPFNLSTTISFEMPVGGDVTIKIYNMLGQEVRTLLMSTLQRGTYSVDWSGSDNEGRTLVSGVYIFRMSIGEFTQSRKMILLK